MNMMYHYVYGLFVLLTGLTCSAGQTKLTKLELIAPLADELNECSGMATLGDQWLVGHNDSGNAASLFVFTQKDPQKVREVKVKGVENTDWEELAEDEENIYIGDFGNNNGKRKNLRIYIVSKDDILESDEVGATLIEFSYPEQTSFKKNEDTNFDCEAMVCVGDSLYLFTKNHGNLKSTIYRLSKKEGEYKAEVRGEIESDGLVTGADYRIFKGQPKCVLVGYTSKSFGHHPFILSFDLKSPTAFERSLFKRYNLEGHLQIESIVFETVKRVLLSSEGKKKRDRNMYRVKL